MTSFYKNADFIAKMFLPKKLGMKLGIKTDLKSFQSITDKFKDFSFNLLVFHHVFNYVHI